MGKIEELKQTNILQVRRCFYEGDVWTKNSLSEKTGLSLAGTTNVLAGLLQDGEILQIEDAQSTGGRKSKQYVLNPEYAHILGLVAKRTEKEYVFEVHVDNLAGQSVRREDLISPDGSREELISLVKRVIREDEKITRIAVSVPGVCSAGRISECDIEQIENCDLQSLIAEVTDLPCIIENDVNAAAIGMSHTYSTSGDMVFVYQPAAEYIGCGVVIAGKLYNGFSHRAGEVRYLPWCDEQQQKQLLAERPAYLLEQVIMTLCSVLDPQVICWCSDAFTQDIHPEYRGNMPELIRIEDIGSAIGRGLYEIGRYNQAEGR